MQITTQLALFLDNRPGTLARVCDALSTAKINIYAIATSDTVDHSVIRLVVNDYRRALHVFEEHGTLVVEDDVLHRADRQPALDAHPRPEDGLDLVCLRLTRVAGRRLLRPLPRDFLPRRHWLTVIPPLLLNPPLPPIVPYPLTCAALFSAALPLIVPPAKLMAVL